MFLSWCSSGPDSVHPGSGIPMETMQASGSLGVEACGERNCSPVIVSISSWEEGEVGDTDLVMPLFGSSPRLGLPSNSLY